MTLGVTTVAASTTGADLLVDRLSGRMSRTSGSDLIEGRLRPTPVRPPLIHHRRSVGEGRPTWV